MDKQLKVLITGGTGTLGRAIAQMVEKSSLPWDVTIFSRDFVKQMAMKRQYPQFTYVIGDICDYDSIRKTAVGQDVIIHAAAQKHIQVAEDFPLEAMRVNVHGSQNVAMAAVEGGVSQVIGISTDKVCHPSSIYGMTKSIMERMYIQYAEQFYGITGFHLCRYGNVLGSSGSVLQVWERQDEAGEPITLTDPDMTRFWITPSEAVGLVLIAMDSPPGIVVIPKAPACSMRTLADAIYPYNERMVIGRRPGEKSHELMMTAEEAPRCMDAVEFWALTAQPQYNGMDDPFLVDGYSSDNPINQITIPQMQDMVDEAQSR